MSDTEELKEEDMEFGVDGDEEEETKFEENEVEEEEEKDIELPPKR